MERKTKIILIISGVVLAGGITTGIILYSNKKKREQQELEDDLKRWADLERQGKTEDAQGNVIQIEKPSPTSPIGQIAYVSSDSGYINLRSSAKVDDGWVSNKVGKVSGAGTQIGVVIKQVMGTETDPLKWYLVKLTKPVNMSVGLSSMPFEYAYVSAEQIDMKPVKKLSPDEKEKIINFMPSWMKKYF